ncbi:MAG: glycosyltransferase family 4 protein [Gemmatimonadota bacterium]|nr:glycosyltransferase family 4 protein [Gemmatimonadota bacterium]
MRVVHVLGSAGLGGPQRLVLDLVDAAEHAAAWRHAGCIFLRGTEGMLLDEFRARGPVCFLPMTLPRPLLRRYRSVNMYRMLAGRIRIVAMLPKILRSSGADVVHFHDEPALPWVLAAARRARLPLLLTLHHSVLQIRRWERAFVPYELARRRRPTRFVAVSRAGAREIGRAYPSLTEHVGVVRNGIPVRSTKEIDDARRAVRASLGVGDGEFLFGAVARFGTMKRLHLLVETLFTLRARGAHNVRLLLVGQGPLRDALRERVRALGVEDVTLMPGEVVDGWRYNAALDLLVIASNDFEGLPISMLEAASAGVPVLARPVGDIPEFLGNQRSGLVLDDDSPERIADFVERIMSDESERRAMGKRARNEAMDWSIESCMRRYHGLYGELMSEAQR